MGKQRVEWTEQERADLIKWGAGLLFSHPGKSLVWALKEAQKRLPAHRHRIVVSLSVAPWFQGGVLALKEKPPAPEPLVKIVERVLPTELSAILTDELLHEVVKRLVLPAMERIVKRELPAMLSAEAHRQKKEPAKEERIRLKKVVIAHLLPEQARDVEKEFDGVFTIVAHSDSRPDVFRQSALGADMVVLMTKFISHKHQNAVRELKPYFINGGVSDLKEFLLTMM